MGEIYRMCDSDKGYFGWLLKYERERRSLSVNDIVKEYAAREYIISWRTESLQAVRILSGLFFKGWVSMLTDAGYI